MSTKETIFEHQNCQNLHNYMKAPKKGSARPNYYFYEHNPIRVNDVPGQLVFFQSLLFVCVATSKSASGSTFLQKKTLE